MPDKTHIAMIGACRFPITLADAAREMHVLETDVRGLLALLEEEISRLGLKPISLEPAVPIIDFGGYSWIDLHAFEQALGWVMDPQTAPKDWPAVAEVYHGATRDLLEERLRVAAKAIFQPLRTKVQTRGRKRNFDRRQTTDTVSVRPLAPTVAGSPA